MTTLGTALIVAGLTLVCGSVIFLLFTRRVPSQEFFEEDLDRIIPLMRRAENVASFRASLPKALKIRRASVYRAVLSSP